jgi:hypothetical protein
VLGAEGGRQPDVGQGGQGVEGVGQIARDRGRMGQQRDAFARQGRAQGGVGEEAVEAGWIMVASEGKARAKYQRW